MEDKNEKKVTPVHIFGSDDVLTEIEDIEYYRAQMQEFEAVNRLLGDINDEGEYFISEDIRKELAKLPKELLREDDDSIDATSRVMSKDMYFTIELDEDAGVQVASLYLTEMVHGYGDLTSIRTFIAQFHQSDKIGFGQKAKEKFNVQAIISDIQEGQYINLVMRIQDQIDYALCLEDIVDLASQIYVLRVLALLETKGEKGQEIIRQYNREVKDKGLNKPSIRHRYSTLRKVLDKTIENAGGEKEVFADKKDEIKEIKLEFAKSVQKVEVFRGKNLAGAVRELKKEEKAPQKAPETPKKQTKKAGKVVSVGVGKAKGGSKPKKNETKKDEQKKESPSSGGGGTPLSKFNELGEARPTLKDEGNQATRPAPRSRAVESTPVNPPVTEEIPLAERLLAQKRELGGERQMRGPDEETYNAPAPSGNVLPQNPERPPRTPQAPEIWA